jgi:toxin ParE1/3/4
MPLKLRFETEAKNDLSSIAEWVTLNADPHTAAAYIGRIIARCERLLGAPRGGRVRRKTRPRIFSAPFERSGVILYRVGRSELVILRFLRRGRDVDAIVRRRR